ncbi:CAP10 domain-containing protein [Haematococcus lacustris]|uniref:CAP10 domain-containing protein n=1 Tax=Haematococcus lacustris TaxID=44745 RepID=A0A699Z0D1_HAELA|nr:CAP10 domain-containing protein [Haematococcus lacustris]
MSLFIAIAIYKAKKKTGGKAAMGAKGALHACLATRYPAEQRRSVVVWRGASTDPYLPDFTDANWEGVGAWANRLRLHQMMKEAGPHFDVKLSAALNCASREELLLGVRPAPTTYLNRAT